ncbi:MAG: esterase, partial [Bacteroidetes bacterium]|nr:esterase [Bacteroidota bacterium]
MIKKTIISIITCLLAIVHLEAQNVGTDNIVGTNHIIDSKILNEERQIQIYLPPNYEDSNKTYPVLYIL